MRKRLTLFHHPHKAWGVRAAEDIEKGDFVVEYVGEIISHAEADRRAALCSESEAYHFLQQKCVIDAYAFRNVAAFINFSCEPNLVTKPITAPSGDNAMRRIAFFALRDISPGEELGYRRDTNATSRNSRDKRKPCNCGAAKCVGFV